MIPILLLLAVQAEPAPPATRARARANLASYVQGPDYPRSEMHRDVDVTVGFRLTVSPRGRVSACRITQSSGSVAFDSVTCRIMFSRARFAPARDAAGNAVADIVDSRIRWVMPGG